MSLQRLSLPATMCHAVETISHRKLLQKKKIVFPFRNGKGRRKDKILECGSLGLSYLFPRPRLLKLSRNKDRNVNASSLNGEKPVKEY